MKITIGFAPGEPKQNVVCPLFLVPWSVPCFLSPVSTAPIHTPQIAGMDGPALERETFKWFVENEKKEKQKTLQPLDRNSNELPSFPRHLKSK